MTRVPCVFFQASNRNLRNPAPQALSGSPKARIPLIVSAARLAVYRLALIAWKHSAQ